MRVISVNNSILALPDAVTIRAEAQDGWFVVVSELPGSVLEVYYNQMGRECFRVEKQRPALCMCWFCNLAVKFGGKRAVTNSKTTV
jgi:hypothetical protein